MTRDLPVALLVFTDPGSSRLPYATDERRELTSRLREAERNRLCRLEDCHYSDRDTLFERLREHADRLCLLHFGGHAHLEGVLLDAGIGDEGFTHAAPLARYLTGQCRELRLVFLNACSTRRFAAELIAGGVPRVIATDRRIRDDLARDFAVAFYTELREGKSPRVAFDLARDRVQSRAGESPSSYLHGSSRDLSWTGASPGETIEDERGFPWLYFAAPDTDDDWDLPSEVGNPLFGLPKPPRMPLPEVPFRPLSHFSDVDCGIFFGRGRELRRLILPILEGSGDPVLLLFGTAGVGKSSILHAGLTPRLREASFDVSYSRRDPARGLTGLLADAVEAQPDGAGLLGAWKTREAKVGRPLVIILDQVEESFTGHSGQGQPGGEFAEFVALLSAGLRDTRPLPRGKLILAYRKEWHAEIRRRLIEARVPRTEVFLETLDTAGVVEAIRGPCELGAYRLEIEPGFEEYVARCLCADAGSAIAVVLQVLLARMWEESRRQDPDNPRFTVELFESLRSRRAYFLETLLNEGLERVKDARLPGLCERGQDLALDLLEFHTTAESTVAHRSPAEVLARYDHGPEIVEKLVGILRDAYLLILAGQGHGTRLAHDLLGPIIRDQFHRSVLPGQSARRLLEHVTTDLTQRDGNTTVAMLNDAQLDLVERGRPGMRRWSDKEVELVRVSRDTRDDRRRRESLEAEQNRRAQRWRTWSLRIGVVSLLTFSILFAILFTDARMAKRKAEAKELDANVALRTTKGVLALERGERPKVYELAGELRRIYRNAANPENRMNAEKFIEEVERRCKENAEAKLSGKVTALAIVNGHLWSSCGNGEIYRTDLSKVNSQIDHEADLMKPCPIRRTDGAKTIISMDVSPDRKRLVIADADGTLSVWRSGLNLNEGKRIDLPKGFIAAADDSATVVPVPQFPVPQLQAVFAGDSRILAIGKNLNRNWVVESYCYDAKADCWNRRDRPTRLGKVKELTSRVLFVRGPGTPAEDGYLLIGLKEDDHDAPKLDCYRLQAGELSVQGSPPELGDKALDLSEIQSKVLSRRRSVKSLGRVDLKGEDGDYNYLVLGDNEGEVYSQLLWGNRSLDRFDDSHRSPVVALAAFDDGTGRFASVDAEGVVRVRKVESRTILTFESHDGPVTALAIDREGRICTGGTDQTIRVYQFKESRPR